MKSPISIVNTLLESGYADYDSNLDPFSDPKNVSDTDLGRSYISGDDVTDPVYGVGHWIVVLNIFNLLTADDCYYDEMSPEEQEVVNTVDRVYIERTTLNDPGRSRLSVELFTREAIRRLSFELGPPDEHGRWFVRLVSVEYK